MTPCHPLPYHPSLIAHDNLKTAVGVKEWVVNRQQPRRRQFHVVMTRLIAAAITVTYLHVASAFSSGNAFIREDVFCNNRCSALKSNSHDSTEKGETIQEKLDPIRRRRQRNFEHWGVEHFASPAACPSTFGEVADEVFRAISGTLCGLQRPDPNVASNAMHQSVLDYRPTQPHWASKRRWVNGDDNDDVRKESSRKAQCIPARMGIEIDGAAYLSDQYNDEGRAMRILSLQIAQRLSTLPWEDIDSSVRRRSVAVYFNSVEQSLLASRELSRWKSKEEKNSLGHITIHCLGQDSLPKSMVKGKSQQNQQMGEKHNTNTDPGERIILIVKPSDYDADSLVPVHSDSRSHAANELQPTIKANVVEKLQTLLFQASAASIPAVVLSPRLSELAPLQSMSKRTGPSGFEQSGFQKSSTYGGIEPPIGPTSWLLRDLVPPIYVWAGCANIIGRRKRSRRSIAALFHQQQQCDAAIDEDEKNMNVSGDEETYSYYSRVALTQSAMETGHSWHMFAVKERLEPLHSVSTSRTTLSHTKHTLEQVDRDISYHYIGSSNASSGRPSSRIMNDVFEEFCESSSTE